MKSVRSFGAVILVTRYTIGYLAAGFLVSGPLWLAVDMRFGPIVPSLTAGLILTALYYLLGPLSRHDWHKMLLPDFKLFELACTRNATIDAADLLVAAAIHRMATSAEESYLTAAWIEFLLMITAYGRVKFDTWMFEDFYRAQVKAVVHDAAELAKVAPAPAGAPPVAVPPVPAPVSPIPAPPAENR